MQNTDKYDLNDLPMSKEIEQSIIGAILNNNLAYDKVSDLISEEDFFEKTHQILYKIIQEKLENAQIVDLLTLSSSIAKYGLNYDYIKLLVESVYPSEHIRQYGEILIELSTRRKLINLGKALLENGFNENLTGKEQMEIAEKVFFGMHSKTNHNKTIQFFDGAKIVLNNTFNIVNNEQISTGVKTGFRELDHLMGGLRPGELVILAGRPAMGKTAFATNMATNMCLNSTKTNNRVLFISLEMPYEQICLRIISSLSNVPLNSLMHAKISPKAVKDCLHSIENFKNLPFYVYDASFLSPGGLRSLVRQMKRQLNINVIIVDYLQLMESSNKQENREQEISKISRSLKLIAKELSVVVIALSQMSRDIEKRKELGEPKLSDLRGSGSIEQDADSIIFLFKEDDIVKLSLAKNRNGALGVFPIRFIPEITTFMDF